MIGRQPGETSAAVIERAVSAATTMLDDDLAGLLLSIWRLGYSDGVIEGSAETWALANRVLERSFKGEKGEGDGDSE